MNILVSAVLSLSLLGVGAVDTPVEFESGPPVAQAQEMAPMVTLGQCALWKKLDPPRYRKYCL